MLPLLVLLFSIGCNCASTPWTRYILAPDSRSPKPRGIQETHGDVEKHGLDVVLHEGSRITYDFGREVGGLITFLLETNSTSPLGLSYTESPLFIGNYSDDATGSVASMNWDQALNISIPSSALGITFNYTTPTERYRGGFRFLTVTTLAGSGTVSLSKLTCLLGFQPGVDNPKDAYTGYFYTPDDELLVRTFYAGAYTVQTNTAPSNTGRYLPAVNPGWAYNASLGVDGPILVDGAKRDRAVWPGDLGISAPSSYLAFGPKYGYAPVRNALDTMFNFQNATTGMFPYAGPDTNSFRNGLLSDTYHSWTLVAIAEYAMYSGDVDWVQLHWENITKAVEFTISEIASEGLQNQININDWGRQGSGGLNSALNAISYGMLIKLSDLAAYHDNDTSFSWRTKADALKVAYNNLLWDESAGLYRDNTTTSLHPQDGNALALYFNLTQSQDQKSAISRSLVRNWNDIGPVTPELPDVISPFISSFEVLGHFIAGEPDRALELTRRLWGYALDSPIVGGTTIPEGFSANGSLYYRGAAGYNYDASYTSNAHSWSSGPTQSLLTQLLGLRITSSAGKSWELFPTPAGNISHVKGGFETPLGMFQAEWKIAPTNETMIVNVNTPEGTRGVVGLPRGARTVVVNGSRHGLNASLGRLNGQFELDGGKAELIIDLER